MTTIYENAKETAKKIRKVLKQAFPGIKFSVRSETYSMGSSVDVHWTDGPFQDDVDAILNRFKSGYFDGMQDMYVHTGYTWEGQTVYGAKYISSHRTFSPERRAIILEYLTTHNYKDDGYGNYSKSCCVEVEKALIESKQLSGHPSKLVTPEPVTEPASVEPPAVASRSNVIPFPNKVNPLSGLTPEQRFKMEILRIVLNDQDIEDTLLNVSVDELFKSTAAELFA